MAAKFRKVLAYVVLALMIFEMVPGVAYAKIGETMATAANEVFAAATQESGKDNAADATVDKEDATTLAVSDETAGKTGDNASEDGISGQMVATVVAQDLSTQIASDLMSSDTPTTMGIESASGADPTADGTKLFTNLGDALTVDYKNNAYSSSNDYSEGWEPATNVTHKDAAGNTVAVWQSKAKSIEKSSGYGTMLFMPQYNGNKASANQSIYVVYDYVYDHPDEESYNSKFEIKPGVNTSETNNYKSSMPLEKTSEHLSSIQETDWRTGVIECTNNYSAVWLSHRWSKTDGGASQLNVAYVSNIRFYTSVDDLPENCKATLKFDFDESIGTFSEYAIRSSNGADNAVTKTREEIEKTTFPINTSISATYTITNPAYRFVSLTMTGNDGNEIDISHTIAGGNKLSGTKLTEPGQNTVHVEVEKYAPIVDAFDIELDKGDSKGYQKLNKESLTTKNYREGDYWTFQQVSEIDKGYKYKLHMSANMQDYTKITFTKNGEEIPVEDFSQWSYDVVPGNERQELLFTFESEESVPRQVLVFLWPTLDWNQAFGSTTPEDLHTNEIPDLSSNYYEVVNGIQFPNPYGAYHDTTKRSFLYDSSKGDSGHEKVFTSTSSSEGSTDTTITFKAQKSGQISFDYMVAVDESDSAGSYLLTIGKGWDADVSEDVYQAIEWRHYECYLENTDEDGLTIEFYNFKSANPKKTYMLISNLSFSTEKRTVTIATEGEQGCGTIFANGVEAKTGEFNKGSRISFVAAPASGYVFVGWFDGQHNLLSRDSSYSLLVKEDCAVTARFLKLENNVALVGETLYESLNDALVAANSGNEKLVRLMADTTIDKALEVPANVTLLIPCSGTDLGYNPSDVRSGYPPEGTLTSPNTGAKAEKFRTLTVSSGATLTINGIVIANAVVGRPSAGWFDQDVNGGAGYIQNKGSIVVNEGGTLESPGYVEGPGKIEVMSGGTVADLYVVRHWRGGTQASEMYLKGLYPMNEYDSHNISCSITVHSGGTYTGIVRMYAVGSYFTTRFPQVDKANGLIRLSEGGYLTKTYDQSSGRETYNMHGGGSLASSTLVIIDMELSTGDYLYPWNGIYDFKFNDGDYSFDNSFKFMPGATVEAKNAQINVPEDTTVVFYNKFDDVQNTGNTQYPLDRAAAELVLDESSSLTNNGTFAGTIKTKSAKIFSGEKAAWTVTTKEANGYCSPLPQGGVTRELTFMQGNSEGELPITREGYTWVFGGAHGNEVVWTGAPTEKIDEAIQRYEDADKAGWQNAFDQEVKNAIEAAKSALPLPNDAAGQAEVQELADAINKAIDKASAHENLKQFVVVFDPDGGTFDDSIEGLGSDGKVRRQIVYGDALGVLPTAHKNGFTLQGWKSEGGAIDGQTVVKGAMVLTAIWGSESAAITYDLDNGQWKEADKDWQAEHSSHDINTPTFVIPSPVREGYTFMGWIKNNAGSPEINVVVEEGSFGLLTFTAQWQPNAYTLTWLKEDGQVFETQTVACEETLVAPETAPARDGYEFVAWETMEPEGLEVGPAGYPEKMPAFNVTVRAKWNSYLDLLNTMTNELKNPSNLASEELNKARTYYENLNEEQQLQYDARDLIHAILVAALPEVNKTLDNGSGEEKGIAKVFVDTKDSTVLKVELKKPDTKAESMLNVPFLKQLFGATEVDNLWVGGEETTKDQFPIMKAAAYAALAGKEVTVSGSKQIAPNTETDFTKWLRENQKTLEISILDGCYVPVTLGTKNSGGPTYAVYFYTSSNEPNTDTLKTIHFNSEGGSAIPDIKEETGEPVREPAKPTRAGYTFDGWYESEEEANAPEVAAASIALLAANNSEYEFNTMPKTSITLYARWLPNTYTLKFDAGGATGTVPAPQTLAYDQTYHLPNAENLTKVGYKFVGWQGEDGILRQVGSEVSGLSHIAGGSVILKAQWAPQTYTVTFKVDDDVTLNEGDKTKQVTFDQSYGTLPKPYRAGYTFINWAIEDGKGGEPATQVTSETKVTIANHHILVALWKQNGNVKFTVETYLQKTEGDEYEKSNNIQTETAAEGSKVYAQVAELLGFHLNEAISVTSGVVKTNPQLTLKLYYDRDVHTVTWEVDGEAVQIDELRYGATPVFDAKEHGNIWDTDAYHGELEGWSVRKEDGTLTPVETLSKVSADITYVANIKKTYEAQSPDGETTWRTLQIAMDKAPKNAANPTIVSIHGSVTLPSTGLTVPSGILLLLPYTEGDTGYDSRSNGNGFIPGPPVNRETRMPNAGIARDATPYSTLTIPMGATLTVRGRVLVNALVGRPTAGWYDQDVTGGWGHLIANGSVVVASGGIFDCHGYVDGSGTVTAQRGGTVGDLFIVRHWRGGSQAAAMYSCGVYPYNEYDCHNISVPVTVEAGGSLVGLVTMYAAEGYYSTRFPLVDPQNGLMRQGSSGSVTRTWSGSGETWVMTGDTRLSRSSLVILDVPLTTGDFIYPIDGDISWVMKHGTFSFEDSYKFLTGAEVLAQNAQVVVTKGAQVVFYESFVDPPNTASTQYPLRPAATLTLDATSTLQNQGGTFGGHISCQGKAISGEPGSLWQLTTQEANGYYQDQTIGNEVQTLSHTLDISVAGHSWKVGRTGKILWDGEKDDPIELAIEAGLATAAQSMTGSEKAPYTISAKEPAQDGTITWVVDVAKEGLDQSAGTIGYDLAERFLWAAHDLQEVVAEVSTLTGSEPEVHYLAKDDPDPLTIRLFAQRLGLVDASAPKVEDSSKDPAPPTDQAATELSGSQQEATSEPADTFAPSHAETLATSATVKDLVGKHAKLLITSVVEEGKTEPTTITYDVVFTCSDDSALQKSSAMALYRLYNPFDQVHLFTTDKNETEELAEAGWNLEGIAWWAPALGEGDHTILRFYNPYSHDHYYVSAQDERQLASLARAGWIQDGEAARFDSARPQEGYKITQLFNPWRSIDTHLWTTDQTEVALNVDLGWKEDVSDIWGLPAPAASASEAAPLS